MLAPYMMEFPTSIMVFITIVYRAEQMSSSHGTRSKNLLSQKQKHQNEQECAITRQNVLNLRSHSFFSSEASKSNNNDDSKSSVDNANENDESMDKADKAIEEDDVDMLDGTETETESYPRYGGGERPGPRRKSCPWCNNRKCTHCRCDSYARCDHSRNEQCKRVRYGRRLVCNTCERNKLKDSGKKYPPRENTKATTPKLLCKKESDEADEDCMVFHEDPTDNHGDESVKPSTLPPTPQVSKKGGSVSEAAQQSTLVQAMTVLTTQSRNRPKLNISTQDEQDPFDVALQSFMSTSTTPVSISALLLPISPIDGGMGNTQFNFFPMNNSQSSSMQDAFVHPLSGSTLDSTEASSFLDLMSSADYYSERLLQENSKKHKGKIQQQPQAESDVGSDKESIGVNSPHCDKSDYYHSFPTTTSSINYTI
jgi:hypothetical protein